MQPLQDSEGGVLSPPFSFFLKIREAQSWQDNAKIIQKLIQLLGRAFKNKSSFKILLNILSLFSASQSKNSYVIFVLHTELYS